MDMDLTTAIGTIVAGVITPFIVAVMTHPTMNPSQKRTISLGVAMAVGVVTAVATGFISEVPENIQHGLGRVIIIMGIVVALAQVYYRQFKDAVRSLETATSDPEGIDA